MNHRYYCQLLALPGNDALVCQVANAGQLNRGALNRGASLEGKQYVADLSVAPAA
jgi:hypothetical protein